MVSERSMVVGTSAMQLTWTPARRVAAKRRRHLMLVPAARTADQARSIPPARGLSDVPHLTPRRPTVVPGPRTAACRDGDVVQVMPAAAPLPQARRPGADTDAPSAVVTPAARPHAGAVRIRWVRVALVVSVLIGALVLAFGPPSPQAQVQSVPVSQAAPAPADALAWTVDGRGVVVQQRQSVWLIAQALRPEADPRPAVTAISEANGLRNGVVRVGQVLQIPSELRH